MALKYVRMVMILYGLLTLLPRSPHEGKLIVKRIVALPGDTVRQGYGGHPLIFDNTTLCR